MANAICALSSLHANQIRIEQGLESLSRDAKGTQATYFHDEAVFQLTSAKQQHGRYRESDAIAALHLVSYSQMSGGNGDWQSVFTVTCEWVAQTGLFLEESNARRVFDGLSSTGQLIVKMVLVSFCSNSCLVATHVHLAIVDRYFLYFDFRPTPTLS